VIRTILADDEQPALDELCFLLRDVADVEIVGQARDGVDAFRLIAAEQPQLALLDVQMPGLDGFQVVREVQTLERAPLVIFVTAFDRYAIRAFEVSAVDYLLKPVSADRLARALERVRIRLVGDARLDQKLSHFLAGLPMPSRRLTRVPVRRRKNLHLIDTQDIVFAQVKDGTVFIQTHDAEDIVSYRTLEEFAAELDPEMFHRVHRSYLANVEHIREIIPQASGNYELLMDDRESTRIPLSRQHARELRRLYKW
jgi:DNA-binding LytR/AlgR family response regulator